jgi:hypothetical protein
MIRRIEFNEIRPGDVLVFKGNPNSFLNRNLSKMIKKKVPKWDEWGWHMAPVVAIDTFMDAQWPKLKLSKISDYKPENIRAYRIKETEPTKDQLDKFINYTLGRSYDWFVYILTAFAIQLRPGIDFPRVINRTYDCWETTWEFAGFIDSDITHDYNYPFLTDMISLAGEC